MKTLVEIEEMVNDGKLCFHHSAGEKGYISTKAIMAGYDYEGRFGRGYVVRFPNKVGFNGKMSNNYHRIDYYIFKK